MKVKLFTRSHSSILPEDGRVDDGLQFTASQHAYVKSIELKDKCKKDAWLKEYLRTSSNKICALSHLIEYVTKNEIQNIISFGAGECVLEYLLSCACSGDSIVMATDFDEFLVKNAAEIFPSLRCAKYDLFKDELEKVVGDTRFELAVFFGSSYVMDDTDFIRVVNDMRHVGINKMIDYQGGFASWSDVSISVARDIYHDLRRRVGMPRYKGKMHGFGRTRNEMRKLYRMAGLKIIEETAVAPYKYVSVLSCL